MSYFDIVLVKDSKFFLTEVKSKHDTFSWNQTTNLLDLIGKGVSVCLVRIDKGKITEEKWIN